MPFPLRKIRLCRRRTASPQRVHRRDANVPCEFRRLVETPTVVTRDVQRHRDEKVGPVQDGCARLRHQPCERARNRTPLVVLQDVQDVAQRALVCAYRTADRDQAWMIRAARAHRAQGPLEPPGRERVTADPAERFRQGMNAGPARGTDRARQGRIQRIPARRASRRDEHGQRSFRQVAKACRR